jgi:Myb-like DNA-binding domain
MNVQPADTHVAHNTEPAAVMPLADYFKSINQDVTGALQVDGHYHGWVAPDIIEQYGLQGDADAAWEAEGGGAFSFKIDKRAIPAALRAKGWSDAKAFSATQLRKNPNAYFYRHVAPHQSQAQGEWSEEEHAAFLKVAKEQGVGDKWGLFASHIGQRVGYQCSAYYREVIIPSGLVMDPRWRMTRTGKAVYVG